MGADEHASEAGHRNTPTAGGELMGASNVQVGDDLPHVRFSRVPEWLLYDATVSHLAVRLYAVLDRYAGSNGEAWPSRKTLAKRIGVKSLNTIDGALKDLVSIGAVTVVGRVDQAGDRATNRYVVHLFQGVAQQTAPPLAEGLGWNGGSMRPGGSADCATGGSADCTGVAQQTAPEGEPVEGEPVEEDLFVDAASKRMGGSTDCATPLGLDVAAAVTSLLAKHGTQLDEAIAVAAAEYNTKNARDLPRYLSTFSLQELQRDAAAHVACEAKRSELVAKMCPLPGHTGAAGVDTDGDPDCADCASLSGQVATVPGQQPAAGIATVRASLGQAKVS